MSDKNEKMTASAKLNAVMEKNRKVLLGLLIAVIVALVAVIVVEIVKSKTVEKNLAAIDQISYELTNASADLSEEELAKREDTALEAVQAYTGKSGIAGVRANLLAADLSYDKKNYDAAISYWEAAAAKGKKSYTAALAYYNIASCDEELGKTEEAAEMYKKASEDKDFVLNFHAKFSYARVLETLGKYDEAVEVYKTMNEERPADQWSNLAKTRIISLQSEGKIQ